jgi:DNA polymerase-3 subunit delta
MKLPPRDIDRFLKAPGGAVAALFFGPDEGLVRERAQVLGKTVLGADDDPFARTDITLKDLSDDPARLADELQSPTLLGGRRLIGLSNAADAVTDAVANALNIESASGFLIVMAGELRPQSKLRKLFEAAPNAAAVACYPDTARDLDGLIRSVIAETGHRIDDAAVAFLKSHLGSDRMVSRGELEKLALYKGADPSPITAAEAREAVGDSAALAAEDVIDATVTGDVKGLDRALRRLESAGESPIGLLRLLARRLQRLHLLVAARAEGLDMERALASLTPRSFWPESDALKKAASGWTPARLATAMEIVLNAEEKAKRTGSPAEALCAEACLRIAGAARQMAGRH